MKNLKCHIITPANEQERRIAEGYGATRPDGTVEIFTAADSPLLDRISQRITGRGFCLPYDCAVRRRKASCEIGAKLGEIGG